MNPALRFGLGNALHAVPAGLVAEMLVNLVPLHTENDFLVAAGIAGAGGDLFNIPAVRPGIACVHFVKIAGEEGRLVPAGAGPDFHDDPVEILARIDE